MSTVPSLTPEQRSTLIAKALEGKLPSLGDVACAGEQAGSSPGRHEPGCSVSATQTKVRLFSTPKAMLS